jgi:hypothetical protein
MDGCTDNAKIQIEMWYGGQWHWYTGSVRMYSDPFLKSVDFLAHDTHEKGGKGKRNAFQDHKTAP